MNKNTKKTSKNIASKAAKILNDPKASETAKKLAASALSQTGTSKQTGAEMEDLASKVLQSDQYSHEVEELAGSVLAQSNKQR